MKHQAELRAAELCDISLSSVGDEDTNSVSDSSDTNVTVLK